jgi:hypothetical protein
MKVNKVAILMGVAGLVYGTSSNAFYNVDASLTAPSDYDFGYTYSTLYNLQILRTKDGVLDTKPAFTRTTDGAYYNYEWTSEFNAHYSGDDVDSIVPDGMIIQMIFNRSNTTWFHDSLQGLYVPSENKIGSDNTVGTAVKFSFEFNNQTNRDYFLNFDMSSTGGTNLAFYIYKGANEYQIDSGGSNATFHRVYIPAYTKVKLQTGSTTGAYYFDAWYLKDLGVSNTWNEGYDEGYIDGENAVIASGGLQGIIEGVFEGIVAIFGIEIFNGVTLGAVALFPLVITLFVFVMKIVKMGG